MHQSARPSHYKSWLKSAMERWWTGATLTILCEMLCHWFEKTTSWSTWIEHVAFKLFEEIWPSEKIKPIRSGILWKSLLRLEVVWSCPCFWCWRSCPDDHGSNHWSRTFQCIYQIIKPYQTIHPFFLRSKKVRKVGFYQWPEAPIFRPAWKRNRSEGGHCFASYSRRQDMIRTDENWFDCKVLWTDESSQPIQ